MCKNFKHPGRQGLVSLSLLFFVCLAVLLSCNRNDALDPLSADGGDGTISLGAGVNLQTKATDNGFELTDTLGLYLAKWPDAATPGTLADSGNYADNARFHLIGTPDTWQPDRPYYYPADGSKLDFYAYYPYRTPAFGNGTVIDLRVAANQSAYADYTRSDFMTANAKGVARSSQKVHLDFYHRLSQIVFVLAPGTGFTKDDLRQAKVKIINAISDARFNLAETDSVPIAGTTRQDITPCGAWTDRGDSLGGVMAIMVPQQVNTATYVELMIGSRRFTFKPVDPFTLNPGCSHMFTIRVNNTGIDIETQIHPWNECKPLSGDAVEEEAIVRMITYKDSVSFKVERNGDIEVDWGDGERQINIFNHLYVDGLASHEIKFYGTDSTLLKFDCQDSNRITSIDFNENIALTNLNCSNNWLTSLDVSKNRALTNLSCSNNQIGVLNISQNKELKLLGCGKNQLRTLDLTNNVKLFVLNCLENQLEKLDIRNATLLNNVTCSQNQLEELDISCNVALTKVSCTANKIRTLNTDQNVKLMILFCQDNQLSRLDFSRNDFLRMLYCRDNPLIENQSALVEMANSLPVKNASGKAILSIGNMASAQWIQAICDERYWTISASQDSD